MGANDGNNAGAGIDLSQFYQVFFEEAGENLESMEQMLLSIDLEQQLLHAVEVLARLLEEDLVELAQVDAGADARAVGCHLGHGVVLP